MKKILAISTVALLAGCACFDCEDDYIDEPAAMETPANVYRGIDDRGCSYLTDENCKRDYKSSKYVQNERQVVYQQPQEPAPVAEEAQPVNYREEVTVEEEKTVTENQPVEAPVTEPVLVETHNAEDFATCEALRATNKETILPDGRPCPSRIRETREPYEIVYKKTTYKTVYEPKTTTDVTFEKEAYKPGIKIKPAVDIEKTLDGTTVSTETTETSEETTLEETFLNDLQLPDEEIPSDDILPQEEVK